MQKELTARTRITSVDYARGVIMIIMAIDHVRDYFHITAYTADPLDPASTSPGLFFTRWITHFCAPAFLFLSGMSAFLSAQNKEVSTASTFMIKRGLFIALFDVIVMSFLLTFNPNYNLTLLTTLWAIGCSMILLGLVLKISPKLILPIGVILFLGHDAMTTWLRSDPTAGNGLLRVLFTGIYFLPINKDHMIGFLYAILPWTGTMFLGYAAAPLLRNTLKLYMLGFTFAILFIVLRVINVYGDLHWQQQATSVRTILAFLNTSKYPPSLQFLCMTLGALCIFLAAAKNSSNRFEKFAVVYGRVPFFYFVTHFFLAHLLTIVAFYATGHTAAEIRDPNTGLWFRPQHFGFELPGMYAIWAFIVLILYYPCRWFYNYKRSKPYGWLKYM